LLLRSEMDKRPLNDALIREILAILRQRESETTPVELTEEELAVWEDIEAQCASEKERAKQERSAARRTRTICLGTVAACLVVLMVVLPPAFGAHSIIDLSKQIANGLLTLFCPEDIGKDYVFRTEHPGLQELYDTVTEYGVTAPVVPMWLPEGFVLEEIKVDKLPSRVKVYSSFLCADKFFLLNINLVGSISVSSFESNNSEYDSVELDGMPFYITTNMDSISIIRETEKTTCSISTNLSREECYNILRSIQGKVVIP